MVSPYISITGYRTLDDVQRMLAVFQKEGGPQLGRKLAVGVMISRKTMRGIPTKWASIFVPKEQIATIFASHRDVLNVLHYADFTDTNVSECLIDALALGGEHVNALQLDMTWPSPNDLQRVSEAYPHIEIVLQVGKRAQDACDNDVERIAQRIDSYGDLIHRVLIDDSMGYGKPMDWEKLLRMYRVVRAACQNRSEPIGIVAAGGLGPDTMDCVGLLPQNFSDISFDAEGQIRSSGSSRDPAEWDRGERYIRAAIATLKQG